MKGNILPRCTPEEQGVPSSAILNFIEAIGSCGQDVHSFMFLRHDHVLAEGWWYPYRSNLSHMLFSLSKSFTSTAVGLAVEEGRLSLDDKVISFFPDDLPEHVSQNLASMQVKHLLSMSTGRDQVTIGLPVRKSEKNWIKKFLSVPVEYEPGTHFFYDSGASYMLSAIIQKVTGRTMLDYLKPRIFEPMGIEDAAWDVCPMGINTGGWGLNLKTEDIAKLGELYLNMGSWNGRRLIPEEWVKEATRAHISNGDDLNSDWAQGYCYQFWRCRHGAYRGDGAFGQFCIVMPEQDAVIAITSGTNDMQGILNLIWQHLLPAMGDKPLARDDLAYTALKDRLSNLALFPPAGLSSSPVSDNISSKKYLMDKNDAGIKYISFSFSDGSCCLTVCDNYGEHHISCGIGRWQTGESDLMGERRLSAASCMWSDENLFVITMRFFTTPYCVTLKFYFEGDRIRLEPSINVSFGPLTYPAISGISK